MSHKTVLITGCSEGGIGHTLALEWNSKGHRVFATARKVDSMTGLQAVGIECLAMDVIDTESLKAVKAQIKEKTGGTLDILVNNAGQGIPTVPSVAELGYTIPILDIDIDTAKKIYDVNVWGVIRTAQVFSSLVIAAEGTIVIIGSLAGIMPYVFGGSSPKPRLNKSTDNL
jgi:1-acylglycerone phosphate reductase